MADITDIEIRKTLKMFGEDIGPITSTTRNIYLQRIKTLQKTNTTATKPNRKSDTTVSRKSDLPPPRLSDYHPISPKPEYPSIVNGTPHRESDMLLPGRNVHSNLTGFSNNQSKQQQKQSIDRLHNFSIESDYQRIAEETSQRKLRPQHASPITFSYGGSVNNSHRLSNSWTSRSSRMSTEDSNNSNGGSSSSGNKKWYNGSLRTMSNYFGGRKERPDLMDISDADLSDTEGDLMSKLRRNYFKKTAASSTENDCNDDKHSKPVKKSTQSFISLHQFPNILLFAFIVFSVVVFASYLMMKSRYSHLDLDVSIDRLVCKPDQHGSRHCFAAAEMGQLRLYLSRLYDILSEHSGQKTCEFALDKRMPFTHARLMLSHRLKRERRPDISDIDWSRLMQLVINLPRDKLDLVAYGNDNVVVNGNGLPEDVTYLESLKPKRSLLCRLQMAAANLISWATYVVCVIAILAALFFIGYCLNVYRLRKIERYERTQIEMRDIVSNISGLLQDQLRQSEFNATTDKFLALVKIRSLLQQTYPKLRDNHFWDQVMRFMYKNEPLIELRRKVGHGEILQWKCRAGWQGSGENYLSGGSSHGFIAPVYRDTYCQNNQLLNHHNPTFSSRLPPKKPITLRCSKKLFTPLF